MTEKKRVTGSDLRKSDTHTIGRHEYREIPELTEKDFARGALYKAGKPVRGRPKSESPKKLVSLRLDPEVIEHFRRRGPGWQRRINDLLRKAARLKPTA
jgi:uncharacterized protein (DUF4415 family)